MSSNRRKGFTLVELALAMAFLAVLLITIAFLVIRIIGIYQSGLAIRAISSSGRQLIDDFSRAISSSTNISDAAFDFTAGSQDRQRTNTPLEATAAPLNDALTYKYYFQKTEPVMEINGEDVFNVPVAGGFCTGLYSYLWNTPYALEEPSNERNNGFTDQNPNINGFTYQPNPADPNSAFSNFKLIRVIDKDRSICTCQRLDGLEDTCPERTGTIDPNHSDFVAPRTDTEHVELLASAEDELAIYDLRIFPVSKSRLTGHVFYSGTFILATLRGGINIFSQGDYCTAEYSQSLRTDFNYCAINKFNFAMRATGKDITAE